MTDNPSPEMLLARAKARENVERTYEATARAFQEIRIAYDRIGASTSPLGTAERNRLYANLSAAQEKYGFERLEHSKALAAYQEYFEPI